MSHHPFAQIRHKRFDDQLTRLARTIGWRLQAPSNIMHLRTVLRSIPSSRAIAETVKPLAMQIKNHGRLPQV